MNRPTPKPRVSTHRRRSPLATAVALGLCGLAWPEFARADVPVEGSRNLALGGASRSSSAGAEGSRVNPAALSFAPELGMDVAYQVRARERSHGVGLVIGDSLNNPRFGLAIAYGLMRGRPRVSYQNVSQESQEHSLLHETHSAAAIVSVTAVPGWLYLGVAGKYLRSELSYEDANEERQDIREKTNAFGLDVGVSLEFKQIVRLSVVGNNLVGNDRPAYSSDKPLQLPALPNALPSTRLTSIGLSPVADRPLELAHGLSVFPTRKANFNLNFDGTYDFSSYRKIDHVRLGFAGSAEYVAGPVPIRAGVRWDGRGPEKIDDITYVAVGLGFRKGSQDNRAGVNAAIALSQQVDGPKPFESIISASLMITLDPRQ